MGLPGVSGMRSITFDPRRPLSLDQNRLGPHFDRVSLDASADSVHRFDFFRVPFGRKLELSAAFDIPEYMRIPGGTSEIARPKAAATAGAASQYRTGHPSLDVHEGVAGGRQRAVVTPTL